MNSQNRAAGSPDLQKSNLPAGLAQPALRALHGAGIWRLEQLTSLTEAQVKQLHGIGPKALDQLRQVMLEKGFAFADDR
jgi:predicted flap endonuclease-1-like 5' DNA nuclease